MFDHESANITIYASGLKGLKTVQGAYSILDERFILSVTVGKDYNVKQDYSNDIVNFCIQHNIQHAISPESPNTVFGFALAAGWQRIIHDIPERNLIVFHDSILPRYRGFNPLVTALLNKDKNIGVTALFATNEYDCGDIVLQKISAFDYPIKLQEAIEKIAALYFDMAVDIINLYLGNQLIGKPQDNQLASYSLWRDEEDYRINWDMNAEDILNFVNVVGYPYKGASALMGDMLIRIKSVTILPDVNIENRTSGKVIFIRSGRPVVACKQGLLSIDEAYYDDGTRVCNYKLRSRFR